MSKIPAQSVQVSFSGHTFTINMPTNGQFIDIESKKLSFSGNKISNMLFSSSRSSMYAFFLIEAIASFMVLIPELNKMLQVKSIFDLNPIQTKEMVKAYQETYLPWHDEIMDFINGVEKELNDQDEAEGTDSQME